MSGIRGGGSGPRYRDYDTFLPDKIMLSAAELAKKCTEHWKRPNLAQIAAVFGFEVQYTPPYWPQVSHHTHQKLVETASLCTGMKPL